MSLFLYSNDEQYNELIQTIRITPVLYPLCAPVQFLSIFFIASFLVRLNYTENHPSNISDLEFHLSPRILSFPLSIIYTIAHDRQRQQTYNIDGPRTWSLSTERTRTGIYENVYHY